MARATAATIADRVETLQLPMAPRRFLDLTSGDDLVFPEPLDHRRPVQLSLAGLNGSVLVIADGRQFDCLHQGDALLELPVQISDVVLKFLPVR